MSARTAQERALRPKPLKVTLSPSTTRTCVCTCTVARVESVSSTNTTSLEGVAADDGTCVVSSASARTRMRSFRVGDSR